MEKICDDIYSSGLYGIQNKSPYRLLERKKKVNEKVSKTRKREDHQEIYIEVCTKAISERVAVISAEDLEMTENYAKT